MYVEEDLELCMLRRLHHPAQWTPSGYVTIPHILSLWPLHGQCAPTTSVRAPNQDVRALQQAVRAAWRALGLLRPLVASIAAKNDATTTATTIIMIGRKARGPGNFNATDQFSVQR
jgi:hypothetical protein